MRNSIALFSTFALTALASTLTLAATNPGKAAMPRIDDRDLVTVHGNTPSLANVKNDRGPVAEDFRLDGMQLLMKRTPEKEAALQHFMEEQTTKGSPNYHHWLTAAEQGRQFGPSKADIEQVKSWLESHGFSVDGVHESGMFMSFSGTAAMVREAFHTEVHNIVLKNGEKHISNVIDPQIPRALAGITAGPSSLHNFFPHPLYKTIHDAHVTTAGENAHYSAERAGANADYTFASGGSTYYAITPGDVEKIYNITPVYTAGYTGKGQTIALIEDGNAYATADWTTFEKTFGLTSYGGTLTTVHPTGKTTCTNPGDVAGTDTEVELDIEYAAATAPGAALEIASCADTSTVFGGLIAVQNLAAATTVIPVMSISYGECEAENGATANASFSTSYQTAAAAGISIFVSSGDESSTSCDPDAADATHGINISGFTSTPYNVSVGGTDFGDTYAGTNSTYWSSTNSTTYESAKSYVPEIPWNDSCAGSLLATKAGYAATYGTAGFCNSSTGEADYLTTGSGSGGPSGCYSGSPSYTGVTGGTCKGQAKPTWQSGLYGNPADAVRDIPDVSMFAADGVWGHYIVICYSRTAEGGAACTGAPSGWTGVGGTSASSPMMAGIQALINQKQGAKQGNPNPTYYSLAKTEYGTAGSTTCNSTKGSAIGTSCIFNDVTQGDMNTNCKKDGTTPGLVNCYLPSGTNGVGTTKNGTYAPAYGSTTGWDFATGIGTPNAYNLVYGW